MRLLIKQKDHIVKEFEFTEGPVLIGRGENCQVFLLDRTVSKQHALISSTPQGKWIVEDLGSTNKTYLNRKVIQNSEIRNGDCLHIGNFVVEIYFQTQADNDATIDMQNNEAALVSKKRISKRKPTGKRKIMAKKPKSNVNACLAIFTGIIIGLMVTVILKFMGGRFF